jgi:thioredoxin
LAPCGGRYAGIVQKESAMSDRSQRGTRSGKAGLQLVSALAIAMLAVSATAARAADAGARRAAATPAVARVLSASGFSFERTVLRADLPVVVDFWAPWCIPCRELEAPLAELAAKFAGRARVVRVNVEWSSRVAQRYDVQALPTILVFKGGMLVSRSTGGASEQDLEDLLAAQLVPATAAAAAAVPAATTTAGTVAAPGR